MNASASKTCFVVAPIGEEHSEVRRRSDLVLRMITQALKPYDYMAVRADAIAHPGLITRQVIRHLIEDPLVIADLSGANPNVYYELAIRHAVRKPVIQIIGTGEHLPFDVREQRTVFIDLANLYASEDQLRATIAAIHQPGYEHETPFSIAAGAVSGAD